MRILRRNTLLLVVVLWTAIGCVGPGYSHDPVRVTVSDIRVIEATLLEQLYQVTLRVQNREERALEIRGGSFDLAINGVDFGSGVTDQGVTVSAYSDAKLDVRMVSTAFGMLRLIRGLQARTGEPLRYEISGRLSVGGHLGGVSFSDAGEFSMAQDAPEGGR
ncbi:MAG: LEA type 2 family protein [Sedimenticolaceae bacterium]